MTDKYIGKKFNRLLVIKRVVSKSIRHPQYECLCDCGNKKITYGYSLPKNVTKSCGCLLKEFYKDRNNVKPRKDIKPNGGSACNYLFLTYRRNATKRELIFDLDKTKFQELTKLNCAYCGRPPSSKTKYAGKKKSDYYIYNGIDRIDNQQGYTLENSITCCNICNKAKGTLSLDDFIKWIDDLINFRKGN